MTRSGWVLRALVALVVLGSLALAVVQMRRADDARSELEVYTRVGRLASAFGAAYLTYDANDVAASSERVAALATERFGKDFEDTRAPAVASLFKEGSSTRATAKEVFVTDVGPRRAKALVVVDVHARSKEAPAQTLVNLSFVVDLVRSGGGWKVDAVASAPQPSVVGPSTTSTTSVAP